MNRYEWGQSVDEGTVYKRSSGRRRYNRERQRRAAKRRRTVQRILDYNLAFDHRGWPQRLAPLFGVSPVTIWRDIQRMEYPPRRLEYYVGDRLVGTIYYYAGTRAPVGVELPNGTWLTPEQATEQCLWVRRFYRHRLEGKWPRCEQW